jgi:undecaprenyl-diphosphatase
VLALVEGIIEWLGPIFEGGVGYMLIAVAVLLERSILIGLIIPGDVVLAVGGIFSARGTLELWIVVLLSAVCAIIGESIGYWLGRRYGVSLLRHIPLANRLVGELKDVQALFQKHGGKAVAIGRYAAVAGAFIPFAAGVGGMRYRRFLLFDIPAIVIWATAIGAVGYVFGGNIDLVDRILARFGYVLLGLLVLGLGYYLWRRKRSRDGEREEPVAEDDAGPPDEARTP